MTRIKKWAGWYYWELLRDGYSPNYPIRHEAWETIACAPTMVGLKEIIRKHGGE